MTEVLRNNFRDREFQFSYLRLKVIYPGKRKKKEKLGGKVNKNFNQEATKIVGINMSKYFSLLRTRYIKFK